MLAYIIPIIRIWRYSVVFNNFMYLFNKYKVIYVLLYFYTMLGIGIYSVQFSLICT